MQPHNPFSYLSYLECSHCGRRFEAGRLNRYCPDCQSPLAARYDLAAARAGLDRDAFAARPKGMWRWHELMPVQDPARVVSLGEGDTPVLHLPRLGADLGMANLYLKDESLNPTATFKARGLAAAVSAGR